MRKILVVDDNLAELSGLCKMLERSGFCVRTATNGMEALEEIRREDFDLLLTDNWMPRMTGLELLRRLPMEHRPKVIMMTGDEDIEKMRRRLDYEFILKPFDRQKLMQMIVRALEADDRAQEKIH